MCCAIMRRLLVFSIVYRLLGVLCGPVSGDPAPGRSPGPPGGLSMVHEGHSDGGGVSEDIPTLLLTKDRTEYGDDVREIIKNSSFDEILDISDNYVHKLKNNDNGHFIATTTQDPVKAPSENGSFFGSSNRDSKNVLSPCSERSILYLRPTDTIIRLNLNGEMTEEVSFIKSTLQPPSLQFDVIHDVFDTTHGVVKHLLYKVILTSMSSVRDFFVESLIDGSPGGRFIETQNHDKSYTGQHQWQQSQKGAVPKSSMDRNRGKKEFLDWITPLAQSWNRHYREDSRKEENTNSDQHTYNCVENSWSRSSVHDHETYSIGWSPNIDADTEARHVSFRISYRTTELHEFVFELEYSMNVQKDCKLFLKHFSGTFDSTSMPTQHLDCAVFFPSVSEVALKAKATTQTHSGLLVHVTRLNVPCSEGGFLKFTGHRRLCGKLEELQHSERSYYFTNLSNTSVRIINRPSFAFEYKIVDYCYNVTLTQKNQTFFLQPAGLLECYFKIHLPYGYKINLMLTTNAHNTSEYTKREFINLSTRKKYFNTNDSANTLCNDGVDSNGLQVQVYDRVADRRWTYCYNEFSQSRKITLISSDNSIVVAVRKYSAEFVRGTPPSPLIDDSEIAHYPSLQVEYSAQNIESVVSQCAFGWIAYQQFCISVIEGKPLSWAAAESECNHLGGHLVSIKSEQEQKIIDKLIINSPSYSDHLAYWIGASDKNFEGDFHWSDAFPFSYTNWFPGWSKYKEYNRQPNDDGLSSQDCVEIRRLFRLPPGNQPNQAPLVNSFMWNDRDCEAENYFVCERPMVDDPVLDAQWRNDCNKSIQLTIEHPKINVWSPGFPHPYPDNVNCYTLIIAPSTHRIIIDFEELVLEDEPNCSYDKLEILEPNIDLLPPQTDGVINSAFFHKVITSFAKRSDVKFQQSDKSKIYSHKILFNKPNDEASIPHKLCGDWSSKLKLLRYVTKGSSLALHFSSDYSHHFNGYKAKVYTESVTSECGDDRQRAYNKSCYLFVSFPEVDWWTAQQVCRSIGAQIASVANVDEQRFITSSIRNEMDYSPRAVYWLGAELTKNGNFVWSDGSNITFQDWLPGQATFEGKKDANGRQCLGLQWQMSPTPMLPSGLYWSAQKCTSLGGYICKRIPNRPDVVRIRNETITGTEGRLVSPGYPKSYPPNTDYYIKLVSPEHTRIVVQFQRIDIEAQEKCLYDYVSVENGEEESILMDPGTEKIPIAMLTGMFNEWRQRKRSVESAEQSLMAHIKLLATTNRFIRLRLHERNKRTLFQENEHTIVDNFPSFSSYVRWCGSYESNMSRFDFVSSKNQALLRFHSDYSIAGMGFSATWTAIDITGCPEQTLTSKEGVFMSPNHPHFLLDQLECTFVLQAPIGKKIWLEFTDFNIIDDASVTIDLGDGELHPFSSPHVLNDGVFLSAFEKLKVILRSGARPLGRGFRATYKVIGHPVLEERTVNLLNASSGVLVQLNYPLPMPPDVDFLQHLIVQLGEVITLELHGVLISDSRGCTGGSALEIYDNYADSNGTVWILCPIHASTQDVPPTKFQQGYTPIFITSYLNTIHIRQRTKMGIEGVPLNASVKIHSDTNYKPKLASRETWVESCMPNPCKFGGKCITNGNVKQCQCKGHYSGRFCGLTICDFDPCIFGHCELTSNNYRCNCLPGYRGETCDHKQKPCADNPCQGRGDCFEKNSGFFCRCHAWWEGQRCERKMIHIPYKPLSERMLQEPFWLGLMTVFVVLGIIGLVWCAKRHFPEKIEKLLAEEADRSRPIGSLHSHHTSLREQLQFTTSIPQTTNTPGVPRSIFGRLGIRKPSILSLSSPQPSGGATARTFSLDDLLRPPPRRTPSPRKKRNNSTPTRKNAAEKKQILQHLISPAPALQIEQRQKLSLDELVHLPDNHLKPLAADGESDVKETTFTENSLSASTLAIRPICDPKLEKKVTFARLLSKVSAEISSGSDMEVGVLNNGSGLSLPVDIPLRASSVPPSPCINEIRSPHSTSSNQGSDSLSSSDLALTDIGRSNKRIKSKVSSADSILAMFKNFASSSAAANLPPSCVISPSTTPTASSPQDDAPGDDDSSTSSMHTPISFSSGAPDSPVFYRQSTIEVPVLDPLSAHKNVPSSNLLHPPSILLEIPSGGNGAINKCLSPIRELPTPMPSPALTPIMPRPQRTRSPSPNEDPLSFSDEDSNKIDNLSQRVCVALHADNARATDSEVENFSLDTPTSEPLPSHSMRRSKFQMRVPAMSISIDIDPPTPEEQTDVKLSPIRPRELIIPTLTIETPSPTKTTPPMQLFPGSPPPQRASVGETNFLFPNKHQQKRFLKQWEKPTSLDLPFTPPLITITSNFSEVESDFDNLSPAPGNVQANAHLCVPGSTGMCYLSPFSIVTRGDRTTSEGNLSSSGYSSMASPGPSRCNSNNPLCPGENEEPGNGSSNSGLNVASIHSNRRQGSSLKTSQSITTSASVTSGGGGNHSRMRNRSDSETLSDEAVLESNDEGIGTDHIDEKIDDGEIKSAKELELFLNKELVETGKSILEEPIAMAQLRLPSIVIQSDMGAEKALSPVSSRSESPLSEKTIGMGRFSPLFYGKKDQQLLFTDSDGLYDFPSSDGKGNLVSAISHRKNTGKKRERKSSFRGHNQSPNKCSSHLEIPNKDTAQTAAQQQHTLQNSKYHHHSLIGTSRKSPKRRPLHRPPVASSSSSSESLLSPMEVSQKNKISSSSTNAPCIIFPESYVKELQKDDEEHLDESRRGAQYLQCNISKKVNKLRAIGNQIRFLKRLEQSIKKKDYQNSHTDSCNEDNNDNFDTAQITAPLLSSPTTSHLVKNRPQAFKVIGRQKRLIHLHENQKSSLKDRHRVSPSDIVSD
ncbi:uncharacterized protein LOC129791455 isoform X2 [Lutzomyia longipalpis]|uniref:uncharacterized protein LOC129791455 isoform X2 n=1 Tax=Lutzomyia longipalpis TaxID=7200 RepID=UPI002483DB1F|nr:uncharacterized protein LOC129791455 isoform X2 [Lutzomyia longipalpis]